MADQLWSPYPPYPASRSQRSVKGLSPFKGSIRVWCKQNAEHRGRQKKGANFPLLTARFSSHSCSNLSLNAFLTCWLAYCLFVLAFYECNLRAHLMAKTYEKPVESEQDILDLNKRLFLPRGTHYPGLFKDSPFPEQRK